MLNAYAIGDPCLHDPCVVAYLLAPEIFDEVWGVCEVDCASTLAIGQSVVSVSERELSGRKPNCFVVTEVDDEKLFALLEERYARLDGPEKIAV
ncbi:hypothetical protein GOC54_32815 [Sinorhizobium meliloti]|nr:hypothetical protein [Sinorhizobium meliloti]